MTLNITHTYDADLVVVLVSPAGTEVELFSDVGGAGDNFTNTTLDDEATASILTASAPFTGSWQPAESLSKIDGEDPNGVWRLQITDDSGGDVGSLDAWTMDITYGDPSDQTDANGQYDIASIAPGYYTIREVPVSGWLQTYPDDQWLYASAGVSEGVARLAAIDRITGGAYWLGETGTQGLVGVASDPRGNLLGLDLGSRWVHSLNPITGEAVPLFDSQLASFPEGGFAIGPDDRGYAVRTLFEQPPELYQILPTTVFLGQLEYGGGPLPGTAQVDGLAFRRDQLYGLVTDLAGGLNDHLVTIDLGTLEVSDVGPLGTNIGLLAGLAYDNTHDVFYATGKDNDYLYRVEPQTGAATLIGPTGLEEVSGMTFATGRGTPLTAGHLIFAESAAMLTDVNFGGAQPVQLGGITYHDVNGSGTLDVGEQPVSVPTFLDENLNRVFDEDVRYFESREAGKTLADLATTVSTLSLSGITGLATDINVQLDITHSFDGDLEATLVSPEGTRVRLFNRLGGSGDDFLNTVLDDEAATSITSASPPFNGTFRPEGLLSSLDGKDPNGVWSLEVVDHAAGDSGVLNSWSLQLSTRERQQFSDPAGHYEYSGLAPGIYDVRETIPTGWLMTEPDVTVGLLDDYEDGNLIEYTRAEFGTFAGFVNNAAAHDGTWGMVAADWMYRTDVSATVQQGDKISAWMRFANNPEGRAQLGFGASALGTLSLVLAPETHELLLENNQGYAFTPIGRTHLSLDADRWYRAEVDWGMGGVIVGRVYDSDGSSLLGSVTAIDNSITSGGIALRGAGGGSVRQLDTITIHRNGAQTVALASNQVAHDTNFGNAQTAVLSGAKWHDLDGDRTIDGNEPFLPGWVVFVDANRNESLDQLAVSPSSADVHHFLDDTSTLVSTLPVYGLSGLVLDVNVTLNINHSYDADLDVVLIGPQGRQVELFSGVGASGDNFLGTTLDDEAATSITSGAAPFSGSFRPEGLLSDFDHLDPNGIWGLKIVDTATGDVGILNSWSLDITYGDPTTTTDANGDYAVSNLAPADYHIREVQQAGWIQTAPVAGYHDVLVTSGQTLTGNSFGNRLPWLSINDVGILEGNSGSQILSFTVTLLDASPLTVTAQYQTADDTATVANGDYAFASGSVVFLSGLPLTQLVHVTVFGDTTVEPTETFFVNMFSAVNATFRRGQGVGTITNDDGMSIPGDFNGDQLLNCADVNALVAAIVAGTESATFRPDGRPSCQPRRSRSMARPGRCHAGKPDRRQPLLERRCQLGRRCGWTGFHPLERPQILVRCRVV